MVTEKDPDLTQPGPARSTNGRMTISRFHLYCFALILMLRKIMFICGGCSSPWVFPMSSYGFLHVFLCGLILVFLPIFVFPNFNICHLKICNHFDFHDFMCYSLVFYILYAPSCIYIHECMIWNCNIVYAFGSCEDKLHETYTMCR